ncbi:MAG: hypothetical protein CL553_11180 [Alcanivorax sp.]|nr:hypothetical protein [Alcanivorax sp.]
MRLSAEYPIPSQANVVSSAQIAPFAVCYPMGVGGLNLICIFISSYDRQERITERADHSISIGPAHSCEFGMKVIQNDHARRPTWHQTPSETRDHDQYVVQPLQTPQLVSYS